MPIYFDKMKAQEITAACVVAAILCGASLLAQTHSATSNNAGGISTVSSETETNALQNILRKVEEQVPELKVTKIRTGRMAMSWQDGTNNISVEYSFRINPGRLNPGAPATRRKPSFDLGVDAAQYASRSAALEAIEKSLTFRQVLPDKKEDYRGGILYQYILETTPKQVICQHGDYVIEIVAVNRDASALIMNVLTNVIDGLDSIAGNSK